MSIYFRNKSKLSINEDSRGLVDKNLIDGYDLMKERNFTKVYKYNNSIKVGVPLEIQRNWLQTNSTF